MVDDVVDEVVFFCCSKRDVIFFSYVCLVIILGVIFVFVGSYDLYIMLGCYVVEYCEISVEKWFRYILYLDWLRRD